VALDAAALAGEQAEALIQVPGDLGRPHRRHPGRRQLDRQGDPVEAPADLHHCSSRAPLDGEVGVDRPGTVAEQGDGVARDGVVARDAQRPQRADVLGGDAQAFPAGRQDTHIGSSGEDGVGQVGHGVEQVLAVVQHEQQATGAEEVDDRPLHGHLRPGQDAQRRRHEVGHRVGGRGRGELGEPDAVWVLWRRVGGDLQG
jgi:hypothetical protein